MSEFPSARGEVQQQQGASARTLGCHWEAKWRALLGPILAAIVGL